MPTETSLHALAERLGILSSYISQSGTEVRSTSDETRVAILAAMGVDASTEARARAALAELVEREGERIAAPVRVVRESAAAHGSEAGAVRIRVPNAWGVRAGERVGYELELREHAAVGLGGVDSGAAGAVGGGADSGGGGVPRMRPRALMRREGEAEAGEGGVLTLGVDPSLAPGYYELRMALTARGRAAEARQTLVVAPHACVMPERGAFGIIANLYSVRGARSWGVGDLTDLRELARWSGERGAAFVGVNPLHALRNVRGEVSPYSPVSRLYRNSVYLDIESIPELAECSEARALLASEPVRAEVARLRVSDRVEYERKARLARPILSALHRCFVARHGVASADAASGISGSGGFTGAGGSSDRARAYAAYLQREGRALESFALFSALDEQLSGDSEAPLTWHEWSPEYRDPSSPEVAAFARSHERELDFHRWIQFELDRQLGAAAEAGARSGLTIGLYQDLAVASAPYGSDVWAYAGIHATGVSIGAPPDDYSATGQNWGLPPLNPHKLFEDGYRFWIALIRSALRHAGALRIDHVLGLFRQFWIPAGMTGPQGAYVRFPTSDLLGILTLESMRHQAVIVGEDLGTVPPEVPGTLREWGILGTRVLLFEREADGAFRPARSYEPLSLTTADTHDMSPLAGFWAGRDIELAAEVGMLGTEKDVSAARRTRQNDRRLLADRLIADGALASPPGSRARDTAEVAERPEEPRSPSAQGVAASHGLAGSASESLPDTTRLLSAVHRFLCSTPAALVGISLDDLAGEIEPVNIPGVGAELFPSWTRRMRVPLDSLERSDVVDALAPCTRRSNEVPRPDPASSP